MAFANFVIRCNKLLSLVKNDDVMNLIAVFCILFVFMLVLYCFCGATEFSVNKDLYISREKVKKKNRIKGALSRAARTGCSTN